MNINTNQIVSISEANQNFSKVARMVKKAERFIFSKITRQNTSLLTWKTTTPLK